MRSLFTIHAGEYLVAQEIESKIKGALVWVPCKDTGIDLLVTNAKQTKMVTIQVKFSKDFTSGMKEKTREGIRSTGWWVLNRKKLLDSKATVWVFVLFSVESKARDFVIIEKKALINLLKRLQRSGKLIHLYLTVNNELRVFETRGLKKHDFKRIGSNEFQHRIRHLTKHLNNWDLIQTYAGL